MGMLVLSRCKDQRIRITVPPSLEPQVIEMLVVEIRGDKARLGFYADKSVAIHRLEVQQRIDAGVPVTTPKPVRPWES